jgi:hypothetical protein
MVVGVVLVVAQALDREQESQRPRAAAPPILSGGSGVGNEFGRSMPGDSTASRWRERAVYAAMSLLVAWHTLAMVVAAAPDSVMTGAARSLVDPYLTLFNLDNYWAFFAPDVGTSYQYRYVVEDAAGQQHLFIPSDKLSRFNPNSIWLRDRYRDIMQSAEADGDITIAELCREHAALRPVAITLLGVEGMAFGPEDRRSGKNPLDPEFVTVHTLKTGQCPAQ